MFGGWLLYYAGIRIVGFLLGFLVGLLITLSFLKALEFVGQGESLLAYRHWLAVGFGVILGILNIRLMPKFYLLIVAVVFGLLGLAYHQGVVEPEALAGRVPSALEPYVTGKTGGAVLAVLFALGGVLLHRYLVILLTAACGASLVASVLNASAPRPWLLPVLAGCGILIQLFISHRVGAHRRDLRKEKGEAPEKERRRSKGKAGEDG